MKIVESAKKIRPVSSWRKWWRRYSTWLALSLPALTVLRDAMPSLQEIIPLGDYKWIVGVLGFVIVIATNIHQKSVSGERDESDQAQ